MGIKNSIPRLDAVDKVTGAAKYTEDLIPINALVGKTLHSTIANGTPNKALLAKRILLCSLFAGKETG